MIFFYIKETCGQLEKVASRHQLLLQILSKIQNGYWVNGELPFWGGTVYRTCNDLIRGFKYGAGLDWSIGARLGWTGALGLGLTGALGLGWTGLEQWNWA